MAEQPAPVQHTVLSTAALARLWEVDQDKLDRYCQRGQLPAKRVGSVWLVNMIALANMVPGIDEADATGAGDRGDHQEAGDVPDPLSIGRDRPTRSAQLRKQG